MNSVTHRPEGEAANDSFTVEERRALFQRIAASEHFKRSARLRDFLLYVGGQSLKEGCPEIHEQEIGSRVFGRPSSYDRSQDNIVRVNATELRKRLELYFASEGANESLVLSIPRGSYKPVFCRRSKELSDGPAIVSNPVAQAVDTIPAVPAAIPGPAACGRIGTIAWMAATLVLAIVSAVLFVQNRTERNTGWDGKPTVAAFWSGFLQLRQQTDIVLPDDSMSVAEDITGRPISLTDYLTRNYMRQIQASPLSADQKADLDNIFVHNLITFGSVRAAQQAIAEIPGVHSTNLTFARYYTADQLKRNNVILIGGQKANPWGYIFDEQLNFLTDYDYEHPMQFVRNRSPKTGEDARYTVGPNARFGYAVIAYLPNPSHSGNAIILAGTDSDATDAAAEFLSSEQQLKKFQNTLKAPKFPYFEVLLKTSRLSGTSFSSDLLAYRTYPNLR
jgi:hypothetical protein